MLIFLNELIFKFKFTLEIGEAPIVILNRIDDVMLGPVFDCGFQLDQNFSASLS